MWFESCAIHHQQPEHQRQPHQAGSWRREEVSTLSSSSAGGSWSRATHTSPLVHDHEHLHGKGGAVPLCLSLPAHCSYRCIPEGVRYYCTLVSLRADAETDRSARYLLGSTPVKEREEAAVNSGRSSLGCKPHKALANLVGSLGTRIITHSIWGLYGQAWHHCIWAVWEGCSPR